MVENVQGEAMQTRREFVKRTAGLSWIARLWL
jgi:hypothetical protein